jgi:hypothetical protein
MVRSIAFSEATSSMPFRPLRPLAPVLLALAALVVTGCGGKDRSAEANALLKATFGGVHRADSGQLAIDVVVAQQSTKPGSAPVSLRLSGPFERGAAGALPKLSLNLLARQPKKTIEVGLTSTGTEIFVRRDGQDYVLPAALVAVVQQGYRQQIAQGGGGPLLSRLGVALHWLRDPRVVGDADVAGTPTTHISAGVDVGAFLDDLARLAGRAKSLPLPTGGLQGALGGAQRKQLVNDVKSASVDLFTGKADKTLRRFSVRLRLEVPSAQQATSGLRSADLSLNFELAALNEPQNISAPARAKPISALPGGSGGAFGLSGAGTGGGTGAGGGAGASPVPGVGQQRYAQCITRAGSDVTKAQRCISLLGQ